MMDMRIIQIKTRLKEIQTEKEKLLKELREIEKGGTHQSKPLSKTLLIGSKIRDCTVETENEKIKLFKELFVCREDVFPKLWENKNKGTKGYSPACLNEWVKRVCGKPKVKCSECPNRSFIKVDKNIIRAHLQGKITIGTYTIKEDDTCIFLAADFDNKGWSEDAMSYAEAGRDMGIPVYLERSRSGNGAHAWIFFSQKVKAKNAREMGAIILAKAQLIRHEISLNSYDRFFPNQDFLPKGGFGNLIVLPLQRLPRNIENTVFLDDNLEPVEDQWELLSNVLRISENDVKELIEKNVNFNPTSAFYYPDATADAQSLIAVRNNNIAGCFTKASQDTKNNEKTVTATDVEVIFDSTVKINIDNMPSKLITALKRTATFANPEFFKLQKMRFSTWNTPKYIFCGELYREIDHRKNRQPNHEFSKVIDHRINYDPNHELSNSFKRTYLSLPRGNFELVKEILEKAGAQIRLTDRRTSGEKLKYRFHGSMNKDQKDAAAEIIKYDYGVLAAPTGSGKTVIACKLIAARKVNTLILVHRKGLMEQWKKALMQFLDVPQEEIGAIGGGKKAIKGKIDIAILQSLSPGGRIETIKDKYGQVIVDECHHIPAVSFETVLNQFSSKYFLGLTATPFRKDGHEPILYMQAGPIRREIKDKVDISIKRRLIIRETSFKIPDTASAKPSIHEIWSYLTEDENRLRLIAHDILDCLKEQRHSLILSERKEYLYKLSKALKNTASGFKYIDFIFTGEVGKRKRNEYLNKIQACIEDKTPFCIFSTGSLSGEGFDLPILDTLFLTMPIAFKGRVIQYAGRLHRKYTSKKEVRIYDYMDKSSGLTISMFKKRLTAYKKMRYELKAQAGS